MLDTYEIEHSHHLDIRPQLRIMRINHFCRNFLWICHEYEILESSSVFNTTGDRDNKIIFMQSLPNFPILIRVKLLINGISIASHNFSALQKVKLSWVWVNQFDIWIRGYKRNYCFNIFIS